MTFHIYMHSHPPNSNMSSPSTPRGSPTGSTPRGSAPWPNPRLWLWWGGRQTGPCPVSLPVLSCVQFLTCFFSLSNPPSPFLKQTEACMSRQARDPTSTRLPSFFLRFQRCECRLAACRLGDSPALGDFQSPVHQHAFNRGTSRDLDCQLINIHVCNWDEIASSSSPCDYIYTILQPTNTDTMSRLLSWCKTSFCLKVLMCNELRMR